MQNPNVVWVVDDDKSIRWVIEKALEKASIPCQSFSRAKDILEALEGELPDVLITDIRMPSMDGFELLDRVHHHYPDLPVIVMTAHSDLDSAVSAFHGGAFEYLPKPFDINEMVDVVQRAGLQSKQKSSLSKVDEAELDAAPEIIGKAPAMQEVFRAIGRLARSHITVLINGESGTGKELVAKALHRHSPRHKKPFIALNMAAIPKDLMESELFGHERGAFTGAHARRSGRFEQANNGTLFLDEIGDTSPAFQLKLLRVLQESEVRPLGSNTRRPVDVRVIAATNHNLEDDVRNGLFRQDLYYRLATFEIAVPPLRERLQDIPHLAHYLLNESINELGKKVGGFTQEAIDCLQAYHWPGNVRELQNEIKRMLVLGQKNTLGAELISPKILRATPDEQRHDMRLITQNTGTLKDRVEFLEVRVVKETLLRHRWNKTRTAEELGLSRVGLRSKMERYGLVQDDDANETAKINL
jgi:two-component system nitrogen regulation response regulator GlnG